MTINRFFFLFAISLFSFVPNTKEITWTEIEKGLHLAEFTASQKSFLGDSKITVLKIDPTHYELDLLGDSECDWGPETVRISRTFL